MGKLQINKGRRILIIAAALLLIGLGAGGFLAGHSAAQYERKAPPVRYGVIKHISAWEDDRLHVIIRGTIPDANLMSEDYFYLDDSVPISWYGKEITMYDLREGDNVAVYWGGTILMSAPGQMLGVEAVRLFR